MRTPTRAAVAVIVTTIALLLAGCTGGGGDEKRDGHADSELVTTGSRVDGGEVTFATVQPPNYIFPMSTWEHWGQSNRIMLWNLMYRPLYWFGNENKPVLNEDYSLAEEPTFSDGNRTVTIKLKDWTFSDGEQLTARNVELWINLLKATKATYPGYVPGKFPDNVEKVSAADEKTVVLTLTKSYNAKWFTYNQLSQITPIPMAWNRTSLDQPVPSASAPDLPDTTPAGARKVWAFLDAQSRDIGSWTTSPLWQVVSGPFRVGESGKVGDPVVLVPNEKYPGKQKPSIDKLDFQTFTSDTAEFSVAQSGDIDYGFVPLTAAGSIGSLKSIYNVVAPYMFSFGFLNLNQQNEHFGPLFRQLYFRQALQHLINQDGWVDSFLHGYGQDSLGAVPTEPSDIYAATVTERYPYSVKDARQLLEDNGWKVEAGGVTTCENPGSGEGQCGEGIPAGFGIDFGIITGNTSSFQAPEMADLQSSASKVGIKITPEAKPPAYWNNVVFPCEAGQAGCDWAANATPVSWDYGLSYYPTGETMYRSDAPFNATNYRDPKMDELIDATLSASDEASGDEAFRAYAEYVAEQLPMNWVPFLAGNPWAGGPVLIGKDLGGVTFNAYGSLTPENWYKTE